jgi:diguanylate cyclase (GGDEF)-like protein
VTALAGLLGLLVVMCLAGGLLARHQAQENAGRTARNDVDSAALALAERCESLDATATATAREVAAYATTYGSVSPFSATAAAARAARDRPQLAFAVLDQTGRALAVTGAPSGHAPAAAGGYGASCLQGRAASSSDLGLAERLPVNARIAGHVRLVGWVVAWYPVDAGALARLRTDLALSGQLSVLGADGAVVTSSAPGGGTTVGLGYAVHAAGPGLPFGLLATAPRPGFGPLLKTGFAVIGLLVLALLLVRPLAAVLSRPVAAELSQSAGQLALSRAALADTFSRFGEVLEHTHDLDGLLDAVISACVLGTGSVAGVSLLVERGPEDAVRLERRGSAGEPAVCDELATFADRYFREVTAEQGGEQDERDAAARGSTGAPQPRFSRLAASGPVLAVPIRNPHAPDRQTVGVLAIARGALASGFDALALTRVRALADRAGVAIANVRLHEEARRLSVTDPLTGVGNVRQLSGSLSREVAGAVRFDRHLTVLMLDLDNFKQVNDTLGHAFGDAVLHDLAHRLLAAVREMDSVARYGGEEFVIVLPDTDTEGGVRVAERVVREVRREPFTRGEVRRQVTVSIGVATFPEHGRDGGELLLAADRALYAAKREGRNRWEVAGSAPSPSRVSQAG